MGCYIYNGIRFKSKDDLINGLDIDVAVDLFRKWKDCNDDFKSWLEDILPKNISKNISNNLQCSEFWQLIFADNKDKPDWLKELMSQEIPATKTGVLKNKNRPKSTSKSKSSSNAKSKKDSLADQVKSKIKTRPKPKAETKPSKRKKVVEAKKQIIPNNLLTTRYTLFRGKDPHSAESVCELERLSDGCFRTKFKVKYSEDELRSIRANEFFVSDWSGGCFRCSKFEKEDTNKVIVRCGKVSSVASTSKFDGSKLRSKIREAKKYRDLSKVKNKEEVSSSEVGLFRLLMIDQDGSSIQHVADLLKIKDRDFVTTERLPFFNSSNDMLFDLEGRPCSNTHQYVICNMSSGEWLKCSGFKTLGNYLVVFHDKQQINEETACCSADSSKRESFWEKFVTGVNDFIEIYNKWNDPGSPYYP